MQPEEKEIAKYKEQGLKKKKKHQIAAEPEKYHIDEEKMTGSPEMLSQDEKTKFTISALARRSGLMGLLTVLILPLGSLLIVGAANMLYSKYMLGDVFVGMIDRFYRPFVFWSIGIIGVWIAVSLILMSFIFSDKKRLIIRANDKLVEDGVEPVVIPRKDGDRNRLIEAFYKIKPPYIIFHILPVIALALAVFAGTVVFDAAAKQKVATDTSRAEADKRMEKAFSKYGVKSSHRVMSFVDRYVYHVGEHGKMTIDLDENGKVLDSSYMIRMSATYPYKDLEKMKAEDVRKEMQGYYSCAKDFKDLFVYPEVTDVPVEFSDYMVNYIDNIREKSSWEKEYEHKAGDHTYIAHCKVSYDEGKSKKTDDDKMKIIYHVQQKDFERTNW